MIDAVPSAGLCPLCAWLASWHATMQIRRDWVVVAELWSLVRFNWRPAPVIYSLPGLYFFLSFRVFTKD